MENILPGHHLVVFVLQVTSKKYKRSKSCRSLLRNVNGRANKLFGCIGHQRIESVGSGTSLLLSVASSSAAGEMWTKSHAATCGSPAYRPIEVLHSSPLSCILSGQVFEEPLHLQHQFTWIHL